MRKTHTASMLKRLCNDEYLTVNDLCDATGIKPRRIKVLMKGGDAPTVKEILLLSYNTSLDYQDVLNAVVQDSKGEISEAYRPPSTINEKGVYRTILDERYDGYKCYCLAA